MDEHEWKMDADLRRFPTDCCAVHSIATELTPEAEARLAEVAQHSTAPTKGCGIDVEHLLAHGKYKTKEPSDGPT